MNRQRLGLAAAIAIVLILALLLLLRRDSGEDDVGGEAGGEPVAVDAGDVPAGDDSLTVELYFPGGGGGLHAERRQVAAKERIEDQIATLVEALIAGPKDDRLRAPLPPEITVRKVYLISEPPPGGTEADETGGTEAGETAGTTVFLDLESPEGTPPPESGSEREILTVFSLVNTVLLNVDGADRVVLLWNGRQPLTFAGHLNTARPLAANRSLIASRS